MNQFTFISVLIFSLFVSLQRHVFLFIASAGCEHEHISLYIKIMYNYNNIIFILA
jgi:hypothetical protein